MSTYIQLFDFISLHAGKHHDVVLHTGGHVTLEEHHTGYRDGASFGLEDIVKIE